MNRFVKAILIVLLYVALFFAALGIISYFLTIELLSKPVYQLYIGIGCLIVSLTIILMLLFSSKEKKEETIEELNEEEAEQTQQLHLNFDNQQISEDTMTGQTIVQNEDDNYQFEQQQEDIIIDEVQLDNTITEKLQQLSDMIKPEEMKVEEDVITINVEQQQPNVAEDTIESSVEQQPSVIEDTIEPSVEQQLNTNEPSNKVDLSDTQINYIKNSNNSYFNEEGMPQLMVTDNVDKNNIKLSEVDYQRQQEERKLQEDIELEAEYARIEKEENEASKYTVAIIILSIAIVGVLGYLLASIFLF